MTILHHRLLGLMRIFPIPCLLIFFSCFFISFPPSGSTIYQHCAHEQGREQHCLQDYGFLSGTCKGRRTFKLGSSLVLCLGIRVFFISIPFIGCRCEQAVSAHLVGNWHRNLQVLLSPRACNFMPPLSFSLFLI
jgi:hypothetical protein